MNVYIIRDKCAQVYAGTPFLANNDDEAIRCFVLSASKSPFKSDFELRRLGTLSEHGVGVLDDDGVFRQQNLWISDYSESLLRTYIGGIENEK